MDSAFTTVSTQRSFVHRDGRHWFSVRRAGSNSISKKKPITLLASSQPIVVQQPQSSRVELTRLELADTPTKREQLEYLVSCALPDSVELYTKVEGTLYTFHGGLGLAPGWIGRGLTVTEERWVSACMLARVNRFGVTVQLSMRGTLALKGLQTTPEENRNYTLFEGGFFGNLFAAEPVAYACEGTKTRLEARDPILQKRVCTTPSHRSASGETLTLCGFVLTGNCDNAANFEMGGTVYDEVIFVYLKPANAASNKERMS